MLQRLAAVTLGLALLTPVGALAEPGTADASASAGTKTRVVKLGHKPIRVSTADKVRLVFEGRKGTLVNLAFDNAGDADACGRPSLKIRGGARVNPWASAYWRLPKKATYVVNKKPCRGEAQAISLQIRKVVRHERMVAGQKAMAGRSTRVTHLLPFRVSADQAAAVTGGPFRVIRPNRTITSFAGDDRESTLPITDYAGSVQYDRPSPVGRYFVESPPALGVTLHIRKIQYISVDGPGVTITRDPAGQVSQSYVFAGQAGQWVYAEVATGSSDPAEARQWISQVHDTTERQAYPDRIGGTCPGGDQYSYCALVQIPETKNYIFNVIGAPGSGTAQVRLRSAAVAAPATLDQGSVTYAVTTPGQWIVGALPELPRQSSGGSDATVTLSNVTGTLGDWHVRAVGGFGTCCFGPQQNSFTMTATTLSSPAPWDEPSGASLAVLVVPPGATGSVDLRVSTAAQ